MEEKIVEIIKNHYWAESIADSSAKEIASHFREFASWINDEWKDLPELDIDELYNYWLKEVKK